MRRKIGEGRSPSMAESKIDQYGLSDKVIELRSTLSLEKTAEIINTKHLPCGAEYINAMTILRWERANGATPDGDRSPSIGDALNPWAEMVTLKNRSEKNIQRLNKIIEELRQDEERLSEVASISNAYVSAMKQHQTVINDIAKYQKEMMRTENIKKVITLMMKILQQYPEVWNEFLLELQRNKEEYELMNML